MNGNELEQLVGVVLVGTAAIAALVVVLRVLRGVAKFVRPASTVVGLVVTASVVSGWIGVEEGQSVRNSVRRALDRVEAQQIVEDVQHSINEARTEFEVELQAELERNGD